MRLSSGKRVGALGPWWGRFGATTVGTLVMGWPGGLGGFVVGIFVDRRLRLRRFSPSRWVHGQRSRQEQTVLVSTFAVAGHVAKADGRVSEPEIDMARTLMTELKLGPEERRQAIAMFTHGKQRHFPLVSMVRRLRRVAGDDSAALERFLASQLRMSLADGEPSERQLHVLRAVGASLRLSAREIDQRLGAYAERMRRAGKALTPRLQDAYALLEVSDVASVAEIKRAYRRMIGRFHPDRLEGQGMPPEDIKRAAARTHEIRAAFNEIRRIRGF